MLAPGRATYSGQYASVDGAINEPKGLQQPRIPIIVGGNGPNVTMRLAAKFADELNLVFRPLPEIPDLIATARQRCEEIDRDPATLRLSLYVADPEVREPGQKRIDTLGALGEIGLDRLVAFPTRYGATREVQAAFAEDCRTAGLLSEARPAAVGWLSSLAPRRAPGGPFSQRGSGRLRPGWIGRSWLDVDRLDDRVELGAVGGRRGRLDGRRRR